MASLRQIRANQLNALMSTGPTTDEGKAVARRNALRHGLAGSGIVLPEDEAEAVNERWAQWHSSLKPDDAYSDWMVERIACSAIRLERCEHHERALLELRSARAGRDWDLERQLAAESLGEALPGSPARVALELRRTGAGCSWLKSRWEALGAVLGAGKAWDEAQRSLALDLLGTPPALRAAPTPADAESPALCALVAAELARLAAIDPRSLAEADADDRTAAELGFGPVDRELALIRRYGRSLTRQIGEFRRQLKLAGRIFDPTGADRRPYVRPPYVESPCTVAVMSPPAPEPPAPPAPAAEPPAARPRVAAVAGRPGFRPVATGSPALRSLAGGLVLDAPPANRQARRAAESRARSHA